MREVLSEGERWNCLTYCRWGYSKLETLQFPLQITEVKQFGPQLALGWVTIQGCTWMLYSYKYCKSARSGETGPPYNIYMWPKKERKK